MVIYFLARIHLATLSAIRSDSQVRAAVIHYRSQASPSNGFDHLENIIRTEAFTTVILKVCDDWKIYLVLCAAAAAITTDCFSSRAGEQWHKPEPAGGGLPHHSLPGRRSVSRPHTVVTAHCCRLLHKWAGGLQPFYLPPASRVRRCRTDADVPSIWQRHQFQSLYWPSNQPKQVLWLRQLW